jgi:ribosomal protein L16 Arg81 hydroxylase
MERATAYEGVIGPGDLLFMPSNWWHHVRGLEKSITVSHNFFNEVNFSHHLTSLLKRTPKLLDAIEKFPVWKEKLRPEWQSRGFSM